MGAFMESWLTPSITNGLFLWNIHFMQVIGVMSCDMLASHVFNIQ